MYMCLMALAATFTFTACGDDDDDNPSGGGQEGSTITENQILGTWYGIDENTSERINIFIMTFTNNGNGTYSEYKAKAKNNWQIEKQSADMKWTLQNGTLNATVTVEGKAMTRKGDLLKLNGNTLTVRRYLDEGETDIVTLTRASGAQEVATIITNMANEKKQGGGQEQQGQNEVNQDNYYKYQESADVQGVGTITIIGEATFENGKCTAIAFSYIYPSKTFANAVWKSYQEDEEMADQLPYYSYDGDKTISYRFDDETVANYAGYTKQQVCDLIKQTVQYTISALGGGE